MCYGSGTAHLHGTCTVCVCVGVSKLHMAGVIALGAKHVMCASNILEKEPYLRVVADLNKLRPRNAPHVDSLDYNLLMERFPVPLTQAQHTILGTLKLSELRALTIHGNIPSKHFRPRMKFTTAEVQLDDEYECDDLDVSHSVSSDSSDCESYEAPQPAEVAKGPKRHTTRRSTAK